MIWRVGIVHVPIRNSGGQVFGLAAARHQQARRYGERQQGAMGIHGECCPELFEHKCDASGMLDRRTPKSAAG
jgi:hypothetical protein